MHFVGRVSLSMTMSLRTIWMVKGVVQLVDVQPTTRTPHAISVTTLDLY